MRHITGQCHCGNIHYELAWPVAGAIKLRACSCGYCSRHGAAWTSDPAARLHVTLAEPKSVQRYEFGTRTAQFHVCRRCGILIFALCTIDGGRYAVVNANTFDDIEPADCVRTVTDFAGEDVATRLARRRRNWMPATIC